MRLSIAFLLVSSVLPAATVTSITLNLGSLTGSTSPLETASPLVLGGGWSFVGSLQLNQATGNPVNSPITLTLTNATFTCDSGQVFSTCGSTQLLFSAIIGFDENYSGSTPYTVAVEGAGSAINTSISFNGGASLFAPLQNVSYAYSNSGAWAAGAGTNSLTMGGRVGLLAGTRSGSTVTLPNSFDITTSPTFSNPVPEPSTAGLAILGSLGLAWASRRRR